MKRKNFLQKKLVIGILLTAMKPATANDPSGTWDYEVQTPQGNMTGEMTIKKSGDDFAVSIDTEQFGALELTNISLDGNDMTANMDMQGAVVDFTFKFDGDTMKGAISTPDGDMDITAKKRAK